MIGNADLSYDAVDGADVDACANSPRSFCEDGTGGMGVCQDERTAARLPRGDLAGIICALVCLPAARRGFDDDELFLRAQCCAYAFIAHGWTS